ncbi:hypothetical protein [Pseudocolwellia agarivorans]|uniref:hypothetical protein n=1 Tax=Pseudocolwellia agarivorans TaxID=1911682 RepID=UPI000985AFD7|nr:hypothetical protein [Pseudocolwellia agarivorans]
MSYKIKLKLLLVTFIMIFSPFTFACGSDAECKNDQICNDNGQCVADGRDWKTLKSDLIKIQNDKSEIISKNHASIESVDLPVTEDVKNGIPNNSNTKSVKFNSTICGLLEFRRKEGNVYVYLGIRNGPITVNFSKNGRITSRMNQRISVDKWYRFDAGSGNVGFTCK